MIKKTEQKTKKEDKKKEPKKSEPSRKDLIETIRKNKKEIQEMRFGLSKKANQKGGTRKGLRKEVARAATKLTAMQKEKQKNRTN